MYDKQVHEILDNLKIFEKMYERLRLVDPLKKKVFSYTNNELRELESRCFTLWEKDKICDNCISIRAYNEDKSYVKIEYTPKSIYMVTAIPVTIGNQRLVLELMKDSTHSMLFESEMNGANSNIHTLIDNLNSLSFKDPLTSIYNRRYINEKLPFDLLNATLSQHTLAVIMVDIDHFKKINDTHGHLTGDSVLKEFAATLSEAMKRESDWVARFGGEEFLICLPGANQTKAIEIAESIRNVIAAKEIQCGAHTIKITASFGVCSLKPSEVDTVETLIAQADRNLYLAKNNGRNRVEG